MSSPENEPAYLENHSPGEELIDLLLERWDTFGGGLDMTHPHTGFAERFQAARVSFFVAVACKVKI